MLHQTRQSSYEEMYPHLVSFVGPTGMSLFLLYQNGEFFRILVLMVVNDGCVGNGKSTIIEMLMRCNAMTTESTMSHSTPAPNLVGDNMPTTGNVHLYADILTSSSERPILYADCEGIASDEILPQGLLDRLRRAAMRRNLKNSERLLWRDNTSKNCRGFAVENLFPKILYTFSDVVVFVLHDSR